jgi:hypothetical protein
MRKILLFICLSSPLLINAQSKAQFTNKEFKLATDKGKAVNYNALGMGILPSTELMVGGNHVNYRRHGFGISWRVGVQAILDVKKLNISGISLENAEKNNWLTGSSTTNYAYSINFNYVKSLTKKIPLYVGMGLTRIRQFDEVNAYGNPETKEWILNDKKTRFDLNFTAGVFVPVTSRFILNFGYDHNPQTLFLGISIASPYNWEDIDMW